MTATASSGWSTKPGTTCPGRINCSSTGSVARATAIAADHDHPRKRLRAFAAVGGRRHRVLIEAGFEPIGFSANMVRTGLDEVAERPLPSGLIDPPGRSPTTCVRIWEADVEAFRDHPGFVEPDEEDWGRFLDEAAAGTDLWKVAWDGDAVVGQVRTRVQEGEAERIGRRRAWTEEISTRKDWRGRGVASALITASLRQLADLGFEEAALSADIDSDTGSFRLYESLGYREVLRSAMLVRPISSVLSGSSATRETAHRHGPPACADRRCDEVCRRRAREARRASFRRRPDVPSLSLRRAGRVWRGHPRHSSGE